MDEKIKVNYLIYIFYMKRAHFIDFDIIVKVNSKPWIIDKNNPKSPILRIEQHDFMSFKSGIYKNQNHKIDFNGTEYWLDNKTFQKLESLSKRLRFQIDNLAFSMQEFLNPDVIQELKFDIDMNLFSSIINTGDDIYIFCSNNNKKNYKNSVERLEEELDKIGLRVKKWFYLSETFYNRNKDEIAYKKAKIVLENILGYRIEGDKFIDIRKDDYNKAFYYDDDKNSLSLFKRINNVLERLIDNTEDNIKISLKSRIQGIENVIIIKEYTHNRIQIFKETIIPIKYSNLIKHFESFKK